MRTEASIKTPTDLRLGAPEESPSHPAHPDPTPPHLRWRAGEPPPGPGPPSTVPGMIYIALLLIDAVEEKMHDDINNAKKSGDEANCEDEVL